jgi:hypothetical protein
MKEIWKIAQVSNYYFKMNEKVIYFFFKSYK